MSTCQLKITSKKENTEKVIVFVDNILKGAGCDEEALKKIDISIDEIFSNIVKYAYPDSEGDVYVTVDIPEELSETNKRKTIISFEDTGIPYDPLQEKDPDISGELKDRKPGGLGIFMVKNLMDKIEYEFKNGKNILKITKENI